MMLFKYYAALSVAAAAVGLILTPIVIWLARSFGLLDQPHVRKVHTTPVPRIGGVAIVVATLLPLIALVVLRFEQLGLADVRPAVTLIVGAASLALIGLLDDLFDIPSKYKLLALLVASGSFCVSGGAVPGVVINGHELLKFGMLSWPVTMLWIVMVTVSINFIDGLDGLAGGIVLIASGVLAMGAIGFGGGTDVRAVLIGVALCGALAGFLVYNSRPARVFMGDSGSMFIGFLLAGACSLATPAVGTTRGILLPALTLSVPLLDTFLTMIRRGVLDRRSLFAAERGHVHHRMLDTGLAHGHAVILLYGVTLAAAAVSLICIFGGYVTSIAAAAVYLFGLFGLFRFVGSVRARDTLLAVRRNRALGREAKRYQSAFYDLQLGFREVRDFETWWKVVCRAAEAFDFAKIDLPMTRRDGTPHIVRWRRFDESMTDVRSIAFDLPIPQRRSDQSLRACVEVLVPGFLESGGQRVALFSRLMGEFGLDRVKYQGTRPSSTPAGTESASSVGSARVIEDGPLPHLRVAVVHDFLYTYAGAERVLEQMLRMFPQADLFSLFDFLPEESRAFLGNRVVNTSFLQRLPLARSRHRAYLPLMPLAAEQFDLSQYDLVLSSSYVAAKGVITRPDQLHVCYCHTPVRFAWDLQNQYLGQVGLSRGVRSAAAKVILHYIRSWDVRSSNGVDVFLTNSDYVGRRVQKFYRRSSETIYPPVDTDFFARCDKKEDFYLTASRMVPYKRMDLIVEAFSTMPDKRLVVIGVGPEMDRIKAKATPNVTLAGYQSQEDLRRYMQQAKAFVFAAEEDFGIAPVEAQACGTPVIAFGRGGSVETVVPNQTGLLFERQDVASIVAAVEAFERGTWDARVIRSHAERFSEAAFREALAACLTREWSQFCEISPTRVVEPEPALEPL